MWTTQTWDSEVAASQVPVVVDFWAPGVVRVEWSLRRSTSCRASRLVGEVRQSEHRRDARSDEVRRHEQFFPTVAKLHERARLRLRSSGARGADALAKELAIG